MTQFIICDILCDFESCGGTKMTSQNGGESDIMKLHATLIGFLRTGSQVFFSQRCLTRNEPPREKTNNLHMRIQRHRSASR